MPGSSSSNQCGATAGWGNFGDNCYHRRAAKPGPKPTRLYDERGLCLEVTPAGGRWWRFKYRLDGKERLLSMGTYPDTGLKAAREKRDRARSLLAAGVDPSEARRAEKASRTAPVLNSFEAVAREWHATIHLAKVSVGHAARTLIRLEQDVPWLGGLVTPISSHANCYKRCAGSNRAGPSKPRIVHCRPAARCSGMRSRLAVPSVTRHRTCAAR